MFIDTNDVKKMTNSQLLAVWQREQDADLRNRAEQELIERGIISLD